MDEQSGVGDIDMRQDAQLEEHGTAIAEIRERMRAHGESIKRHEGLIAKHDETISTLRALIGGLATKDDILALRTDISTQHTESMRDAHNSIPGRVAAIAAVGMFLIAIAGLAINLLHHA